MKLLLELVSLEIVEMLPERLDYRSNQALNQQTLTISLDIVISGKIKQSIAQSRNFVICW